MISVTLTWPEMYVCGTIANMRAISNLRDKRKPRYGAPRDEGSYECHLRGCLGEMAVAKHFNLFWAGTLGDLKAVDVGGKLQVRARSRAHYDLLLHPEDADEDPFVLALTHNSPTIMLPGWILARDGKQQRYWSDPAGDRPAFFVPQRNLRSLAELGGLEAREAA